MLIAYVGKDHRGTLVPDALNYLNSASDSTQPASSLPNPTDMSQVKSYVQQKYQEGYLQGGGIGSDSVSQQASRPDLLNDTALFAGGSNNQPVPLTQEQIQQYIIQKYQEGYSSGFLHSLSTK